MANLMEGLLSEMNRARELKARYKTIPTGFFGAGFIQNTIAQAERAIASGDVVQMIAAYKELKELE